jgi:hypothetical protein
MQVKSIAKGLMTVKEVRHVLDLPIRPGTEYAHPRSILCVTF